MQVDYVGHDINVIYVLYNVVDVLPFNIPFFNYVCGTYYTTLCCMDWFVVEAISKVGVGNDKKIWLSWGLIGC